MGDQFGDSGIFCDVTGKHMPEGVWAEVGQVCLSKGTVDDISNRFSRFPGYSLEAGCLETCVRLRFDCRGREERDVRAVESVVF